MDSPNRPPAAYWVEDLSDARPSANFVYEFESTETQHYDGIYQNPYASLTNTSVHIHQGFDSPPRSIPLTPVPNQSVEYPSTPLQNGRSSAESFENYVPRESHRQLGRSLLTNPQLLHTHPILEDRNWAHLFCGLLHHRDLLGIIRLISKRTVKQVQYHLKTLIFHVSLIVNCDRYLLTNRQRIFRAQESVEGIELLPLLFPASAVPLGIIWSVVKTQLLFRLLLDPSL